MRWLELLAHEIDVITAAARAASQDDLPAADVLLVLMHRYGPDRTGLTWSGDEAAGRAVLARALAP